jgi:hypothetical protein
LTAAGSNIWAWAAYIIWSIYLFYEPNVVFELHGKFFRKRSALFSTHRMITTIGDRLAEAQ